jgi:L-ascorbate metabolism protein UlaG (beta-lactamase superfamily)
MIIKYLGHASFQIKTKNATIITDPYDEKMVGLKFPKVEGDIVTMSHDHKDHNQAKNVKGEPLLIDWPGEFEKNDVRIFGYKAYHDQKKGEERGENILYKFEAEGISILHCGDLGEIPDQKLIDDMGDIDILMIPVGGFYTIDAEMAKEVCLRIEPSIIIPMHYKNSKLNKEIAENLLPVDEFLKKIGTEKKDPLEELKVNKEELLEEESKVVVMKF